MKKRLFWVIAVAILSLLVTTVGCSEATPTPATTPVEPVKIGILEDVSGPVGAYGTTYMEAQKFAIQMVNEAGGIKSLGGAMIEIAEGAGDSTVATATAEVERLINAEKVVAISGPTSTGEALACIPLFERYKTPGVTIMADPTQYQKGYNYLFGVQPSMKNTGSLRADFIDWLAKEYGAPTGSIAICTLTPSFVGEAEGTISRLAELGYNNIVLKEEFPLKITDQTPLVLKLKNANPDLVVYLGAAQDGILFLKACHTYDYYPWLVLSPASSGAMVRDGLPADIAEKTLKRPNVFSAGVSILSDAYARIPSLEAFHSAFKKANPESTFDPVQVSWGATKAFVLARAIENAGSRNSEDITNALRKVDIQAPDPYLVWADVYPRFQMADSGLVATGSIMGAQWSDDLSGLLTIWPEDIAGTTPRIQK